jgi:TetR/AcrR family transcriptional repressor of nem operon
MSTGRPLKYDPDQALEQAMQTFWALGYEATSMQALLGAMGLSKSSLYQRFGDKAQLFERCLRHYCAAQAREMRRRLNAAESPLDFIANSFYAVVDDPDASRARWGCLLMNTATELGTTDPALSAALHDGLARFRGVFQSAVERAQAAGEIPPDRPPQVLAQYLVSSMSGLKTMTKAGVAPEQTRAIVAIILRGLR